MFARLTWLLTTAMTVAACDIAQSVAPSVPDSQSAVPSPTSGPSAISVDEVTLLPGTHYVAVLGETGWVLSKPSENGILALTQLSLVTGEGTTRVISTTEEVTVQMPNLSADGEDQLWFTYVRELLRIDTGDGGIKRWDLPADLGHGFAGGSAWDSSSNTLLFVRESDHRLYRFDPRTESFSIAADLGMVTHGLSRVSISDGSVAINGAHQEGKDYLRAVVVLQRGSVVPEETLGIQAICIGPSGVLTLDETGVVRHQSEVLGQVDFKPNTDVQFVCDAHGSAFTGGDVISADGSAADLVIYRFSATGVTTTVRLPLTAGTFCGGYTGQCSKTWSGPDLETLFPDTQGNAWLVSASGLLQRIRL